MNGTNIPWLLDRSVQTKKKNHPTFHPTWFKVLDDILDSFGFALVFIIIITSVDKV